MKIKIDPDAERGMLLAVIAAIIYYSFWGPNYDFGVIQGNPLAYGLLWYIFNPIHNDRVLWNIVTLAIYFTMLKVQFAQVKKGRIDKWIVYMNLYGVLFCQMIGVTRDVTVTMFAPLVSWNPLFFLFMFLQKFGFNKTMWEQLTPQKAGVPIGPPAIFEWQYLVLLFWFTFPTCYWLGKRLWRRYRK